MGMPGLDGAGRAATVPGGPPGAVRAAGAITLGVEEEFVLLDRRPARRAGRPRTGADARRGAGGAAGADAVPGGDRDPGAHRPGRGGPRAIRLRRLAADAAAPAGLPAGGLRGRAVRHARGWPPSPASPGTGSWPAGTARGWPIGHLRLPRARRGPLPGPGRPGAGPIAALARAAARRHRQLPDRRRARRRMGELAVALQSRWPTTNPPAVWPDAAAYDAAVRRLIGRGRGAGRAQRLLPGPAVPALTDGRGPGRRRLPGRRHRGARGGADPRPVATALAEARRGTPAAAPPARRSPRPWPPRRGTGPPGPESTRSPGSPPMRRRSAPACWIMSAPRSATTATPRRSPGCCAGSRTGGPEPTASGPCSPAPPPRPRSSPHSPARRCPATSRAADACPKPGSRQRQARSSSVSAAAAACPSGP